MLPFPVVAFLQNMWFNDPEGVKRVFEKHPDKRERLIATFLFMGCLTGRRIKKAFPDEVRQEIIWEEVSLEVGGKSSSCFEPDETHIRAVLEKHKPKVVITFGKIAENALLKLRNDVVTWDMVAAPHPAARHATVGKELDQAYARLKMLIDLRKS